METISKGSYVMIIEVVAATTGVIVIVIIARGGVNALPMGNQDVKTDVGDRIPWNLWACCATPSGS